MNNPNQKRKKHLNQQQLWQIWENEEMIWRGKPKPEIEIEIVDDDEAFDRIGGIFFGLLWMLLFYGITIFEYYQNGNVKGLKFIIVLSVVLLMMFIFFKLIPSSITNFLRRKTAYAFDKQGVYFKLWRWGDTRLHFIDFKDIEQIVCIEYQEEKGRIRLIPQKEIFFKTYSFEIGRKHIYPTLEMIDNVKKVSQQIEKLRQMRTTAIKQSPQ